MTIYNVGILIKSGNTENSNTFELIFVSHHISTDNLHNFNLKLPEEDYRYLYQKLDNWKYFNSKTEDEKLVEILEKTGKAVYYNDSECIDIVLDFEEKVINAFKETFSNISVNNEENTIFLENPLNLDESLSLEEYAKIMGEYNDDNGNDDEDEKIKIKIKKL